MYGNMMRANRPADAPRLATLCVEGCDAMPAGCAAEATLVLANAGVEMWKAIDERVYGPERRRRAANGLVRGASVVLTVVALVLWMCSLGWYIIPSAAVVWAFVVLAKWHLLAVRACPEVLVGLPGYPQRKSNGTTHFQRGGEAARAELDRWCAGWYGMLVWLDRLTTFWVHFGRAVVMFEPRAFYYRHQRSCCDRLACLLFPLWWVMSCFTASWNRGNERAWLVARDVHPLSLVHHLIARFRDADGVECRTDLGTLWDKCGRAAYACVAGGDDVLTALRERASAMLFSGARAVGYTLTAEPAVQDHGDFYSAITIPMVLNDERVFPLVPKLGRLLSKWNWSTIQLPPGYGPRRLWDNCKGYAHLEQVPVVGAFVRLWKRLVGPQKNLKKPLQRPGALKDQAVPTADEVTWAWVADHYGVTVAQLQECEDVISGCPSLDHDIMHPVLAAMIAKDTAFKPALWHTRATDRPHFCVSGVLEELAFAGAEVTFGAPGAVTAVAVGLVESLLTGSLVPLVGHALLAAVAWESVLVAVVLHGTYNAWAAAAVMRGRGTYRVARPDKERRCGAKSRAAWPTVLDPTVRFRIQHGQRDVVDVHPTEEWVVKVVGTECGRPVYAYDRVVVRPTPDPWGPEQWAKIDALPCVVERRQRNKAAQRLGPGCGHVPPVLHNCIHSAARAFAIRRGTLRPTCDPVAYEAFQRLLIRFVHPLRLALRAAPEMEMSMEERFEWWVSRPGVYTESRREQLRAAWLGVQTVGLDRRLLFQSKHFGKLELAVKDDPKPRGITAISDLLATIRGPTTQLVGKVVGGLLTPGVYPTLPGCLLPLDVAWMKGAAALEMGQEIVKVMADYPHLSATDASEYDKCHLAPSLAAVDLVSDWLPEPWRGYIDNPEFRSVCYFPTDHGNVRLSYYYHAGILTGEPNVSQSNTLIRIPLDMWAHATKRADQS